MHVHYILWLEYRYTFISIYILYFFISINLPEQKRERERFLYKCSGYEYIQWNSSLLVIITFHHGYAVLSLIGKTVILPLINHHVLKTVRISGNELPQQHI